MGSTTISTWNAPFAFQHHGEQMPTGQVHMGQEPQYDDPDTAQALRTIMGLGITSASQPPSGASDAADAAGLAAIAISAPTIHNQQATAPQHWHAQNQGAIQGLQAIVYEAASLVGIPASFAETPAHKPKERTLEETLSDAADKVLNSQKPEEPILEDKSGMFE